MNEEGLEKWVQAYKRANRTEKSLIVAGLPTLILSFLYSLPGVGDWLKSYASVNKWLSIGLGVVSLVCFVYASYKVWSQPIKDQGKNPLGHLLKGGAKYTKAEGKLFWRLGRRAELSKVWSLISNADIPLIAIQGESGAGKSSLLQGGIEFLLSEEGYELLSLTEPIPCAYCEIRPGDPGADLLRRAGETLRRTGGAAGIEPATLEQFIALARSSRKRMVILLDQFEQLSLDDARHKPVFEFLGAIAKERTNHSITVVIAFRSEYASEWNQFLFQLDSQSGSGNQMAPLPLQLFKKEGKEGGRARDIVATLGKEANLNLAEIVDPLIEFIADKEGRVRPFDLSVSLKCLSELNQDTLQPSDLPPGGFPALLARFLRSRLYHLRDEEREAVFAAIHLKLTRTAYEGRQRVADGLSLEELAKDGGMAPHDLLGALRYLIDPEAGLLEKLPPAPGRAESRYRILHESFIPALQQLAGSALDKERQARRVFNDCWGAYDPAKPSERLLRRSDLKLVEQHWEQMDDLHSEPSKRDYYFISIQHRARSWLMAMAASVFVLVSGLFLLWSYNRERQVEHAHGLMRDWVLQVRTEEDREAYVKLRELAACNLHARLSVLTDVLEWPGDEKVPGLAHVIVGLDPQGSVTREAAALIISALASGKPALNAPDLVTQLRLATNDCLPLATAIVSRMKNPTNQLGDHDIAAFGNALASMTTNLPQEQCREAAVFLVSRMTNTTQRSFIKAHEIDALGRALASLAMNLPQGQRQSIAMPIISRMTNTTVRLDSQEVAALGGALAPLATSLLPEHRQSLAMLIVSRIASNTERLNNQEFAALGKALALLATNLPPEQHQSLAMPIVSRMTNTTERMDRDVDVALAKALASLGTNIPELTVTAATAIVSHVTSMTTGNYISPLGGVAVSLATNLPPEQLVPLASKITSHMTNATERLGSYGIAALGETLAPLAKDLQEQRVAAALALLFRMTNSTKRGTENYEIVRLAEALDLLAIDLPEHRATATTIMLDRMTNTMAQLDSDDFVRFGATLGSLAADLPEQRQIAAAAILSRITNTTQRLNRNQFVPVAVALARLATNLPELRVTAATTIVNFLTNTSEELNFVQADALSQALPSLAKELSSEQRQPLALSIASRMTSTTNPVPYHGIRDLATALAHLATNQLPEQTRLLATPIFSRMTNATKRLDGDEFVEFGNALLPLAKALTGFESLAVARLIDDRLEEEDGFYETLSLAKLWVLWDADIYGNASTNLRIARTIYWLTQVNFCADRDPEENARIVLLRYLEDLTGQKFGDNLWTFIAWAMDPAVAGKFDIRIPERPNWWLFKPMPMPYPAAPPVKAVP